MAVPIFSKIFDAPRAAIQVPEYSTAFQAMKENEPDSIGEPSLTAIGKELNGRFDRLTTHWIKQLGMGKPVVRRGKLTTCIPRRLGAFLSEKSGLIKPIINGRLQFKANKMKRINEAQINHHLLVVNP